MRPRSDKANHRTGTALPRVAAWLALAFTTGLCLFIAACLWLPVAINEDTDWNHEARLLAVQAAPGQGELRYVLVPFTPFGRELVREFLRVSQTSGLTVRTSDALSVVAANPDSLRRWRHLDALLFVRLWLMHAQGDFTRAFTPAAPRAAAPEPVLAAQVEPLFTRGQPAHADPALVDRLRTLVQGAPRGATIRFSVFLFFYENEHEPLLDDLVDAASRGVNVQLLVDFPETEYSDRRTLGQLFKDAFEKRLAAAAQGHSDSWIRTHRHTRPNSKNHTKIFLFSQSGLHRNLAVITSENLTDREREKYQAGFQVESPVLYAQLNAFIDTIAVGNLPDTSVQTVAPDLSQVFFPQPDDDPVYRELDRLRTTPAQMQHGHLSISMARWNHERFALAMKLVQLAREGLDITVVMRSNDEIVDGQIRDVLAHRANIHLHTVDVNQINIHSKYMLFDGYYRASDNPTEIRRGKIVWTGSHNFTGAGLQDNYETWFEIHGEALYDAYLGNFRELETLVPEASP